MFSICIIIAHVIKYIYKMCDENVSNKKKKRKIKKLFKMK